MEDLMETETQNNPMTMPPVKNGLLPYITVDGALKAAEFYTRAFGAEQAFVVPPDEQGRTMHVHLYINGSSLMLSDAYPEHGHPFKTHQGFSLQLVVDDIDSLWERAVAAGVEVVMPVERMFWGDRSHGKAYSPSSPASPLRCRASSMSTPT
jgi:PhnB protein